MKCEQYRELISARLDGELEPDEQKVLETHLAQCADCAVFNTQVEELQRLAAASPSVSMPDELARVILSRAAIRSSRWRRLLGGHYRIPRPLAWAAAVVLVLLGLNAAIGPERSGEPPQIGNGTVVTQQAVQRIVLTEADVVSTYTTQSVSEEL